MAVTKKEAEHLSVPERATVALSQLRSKPNAKSAHFFRTSYRRLQTWLGTVDGPSLDRCEKRSIKYLDKVLRACGKLRDTELHIKMLKELEVENDAKARTTIAKILKKRRDKRKTNVVDLLEMKAKLEDVWPALEHLKGMSHNNSSPAASAENSNHLQLALQRYTQYVNGRPAVTTENLHEYRLTCKEFRYQAELDGESAEAVVKLFKGVQDAIGDWHDWQLLLELSKKQLADGPSKLLTKIEETTAAKLAEAFRAVEETEPQLLSAAGAEAQRKPVRGIRSGRGQQKVA
jgi:CHAD domain-containing protein